MNKNLFNRLLEGMWGAIIILVIAIPVFAASAADEHNPMPEAIPENMGEEEPLIPTNAPGEGIGAWSLNSEKKIANLEERVKRLKIVAKEQQNMPAQSLLQKAAKNLLLVKRMLVENPEQAQMLFHEAWEAVQTAMIEIRETAKTKLTQLQSLIREAEKTVLKGDNQNAEQLLEKARKFALQANVEYENKKYLMVTKLINISRKFALQAISEAKGEIKNEVSEEEDIKAIKQFEILFARAKELVQESKNTKTENLLSKAKGLGEKSQSAYKLKNYKASFSFIQGATRLTLRAISLAEKDGTEKPIKARIKKAQGAVENAKALYPAKELLIKKAENQIKEARLAYLKNDYQLVLKHLEQVRILLEECQK